jgi:hypothetical protein
MRLIGLMGKSKSGKDTVGQMLVEADPRGATLAFADKLKEVIMDLYGATHDDLYTEEGKCKKTPYPLLKCPACSGIRCERVAPTQIVCHTCTAVGEPQAFSTFWEWREIAQFAGTEFGRFVDENVWVRHALTRAEFLLGESALKLVERDGVAVQPRLFVAITDCRFKSEMAAIKKHGGEVWRIRRPATDNRATGLKKHQSETEMDTIPDSEFNRVIVNDATLEVLRQKAVEGLKEYLQRTT